VGLKRELQFIDLDHAAGDITSDFVGSKTWYDDNLDRTLGELAKAASELGLDGDLIRVELKDEAERLAKDLYDTATGEFRDDVKAAFSRMEKYEKFGGVDAVENIKQNIIAFAEETY